MGDLIVAKGTLDLTGATIVVNDPENLCKGGDTYTFARVEGDGTITGVPATQRVGKYSVRVTARRATIGANGFTVILR